MIKGKAKVNGWKFYFKLHSRKDNDPTKVEFHITPVLTHFAVKHPSGCAKGGGLALEWGYWAISIGMFYFDHVTYRLGRYSIKEAIAYLRKTVKTFKDLQSNIMTSEETIEVGRELDNIAGSVEIMRFNQIKQN